ncbi:MAG TPA: DUF1003 domain-containing protein [Candidatus Binatia bacterium]
MPRDVEASCFHCKKALPFELLIPGEVIRPALIETIKKRDPAWTSGRMICVDCLDRLRSEYIEDALEEEVGELTQLEREVIASLKEQQTLTENINLAFERGVTFGQRTADQVASFGGSWTFIGIFFLALSVWIAFNSRALLLQPFDPYPFILLNLILSCLAAVQAPVIMMSQKRLEARDRLRSEKDYQVDLKAELEIRHLNEKLDVLLKHQWQKLLEIQRIQMDFTRELVAQRAQREKA